MKNTVKTIAITAVTTAIITAGTFLAINRQASTEQTALENDNVKVEYFAVENGDFDLIITPKNGYQVTTELELNGGTYYKEGYLVGKSREGFDNTVKTLQNDGIDTAVLQWEEY